MSITSFFSSFIDPILSPILNLDPLWAIATVSFTISLVMTLVYKAMTDQKLMKELKEELKHIQKEMKELSNHPEKFLKAQKKAMDKNMKYMMHSMKPSLITMLPIILVFGWLNANFAFIPLGVGQEFSVTAKVGESGLMTLEVLPAEGVEIISNTSAEIKDGIATWTLKGEKEGSYILRYNFEDESIDQPLKIGDRYAPPVNKISKSSIKETVIGNEKVKVSILGFSMTWIWAYLIFSIIFSTTIRKLLKVH